MSRALAYLIDCAAQCGFEVTALVADESKVNITFRHSAAQKTDPIHEGINDAIQSRLDAINSLNPFPIVGVTEDQAKEIAEKGKTNLHVPADKMQTLDEGHEA